MKKVLFILPFQPLSYFSHLCDQKTDKSHLRDTGFVLGHESEESVLCAGKALLWEPEGAALTVHTARKRARTSSSAMFRLFFPFFLLFSLGLQSRGWRKSLPAQCQQ